MQRFVAKSGLLRQGSRTIGGVSSLIRSQSSQAAQKKIEDENHDAVPKMPSFDYSPEPYSGPSVDEILSKRRQFLNPSMFYLYEKPVNIVEGRMQYLFDEEGRRYLDGFGGIATVNCGHCHPDVVDAIVNQVKRIQHPTTLYLNHAVADFAEALASKMPGNLKSGIHHVLNPDPYRDFATTGQVAGFVSEAIQGVGGIIEAAPGYLPAVYKSIRKAGGLCIADEVQSGFARTGNMWGFEAHGVVPDIVTMAKGIGNGMPLGAVVTTPEIADVLTRRSYFNTFGGNPVSTAAGHAVLRVIEKDNLRENAAVVGGYMKDRLTALKDKYEVIGDVRGRGLMLGVELVTDREMKTPANAETLHILNQMKEMGVLIGKGGFYGNVFRILPPLCFTKADADYLVDVMDYAMSKM
ncbi:Alanine--glyoxylate aminotransferase 2 homolog 3, mitochondrial [Linum perenne]